MASIEINNPAKVISSAEVLATSSVKLNSAKESIEHILGELDAYWAQTQQDAQAFAKGLKENVTKLQTMVDCNKKFASAISAYAESQQKTSTKTIEIV